MLAPTPPSDVAVVRSVHVSTKNLSGHDLPYRISVEQDDFAGRLRMYFSCRQRIGQVTIGIHRGGVLDSSTSAQHAPISATFCATSPPIEWPITMGLFNKRAISSASST